jgi:hypothetical protein
MKTLAILPVAVLLAVSCASPRVVTQLHPEAPEGHYEQGREYIPLSNEGVDVELGFDGIYCEYLVFDLVVINRTSDTLILNPLDFYYEVIDSPAADSSLFPPRMAIHPERVLRQYQQQLEEGENQKEINTIIGFIDAGIGILANTTAFIATEDPGFIADAVLQTLGTADYYVSNDRAIGMEMDAIKEEQEVVREEIFRQAGITPGNFASGLIYFPQYEDAGYLMFCFPAEEQLFQFVYSQTKTLSYD